MLLLFIKMRIHFIDNVVFCAITVVVSLGKIVFSPQKNSREGGLKTPLPFPLLRACYVFPRTTLRQ